MHLARASQEDMTQRMLKPLWTLLKSVEYMYSMCHHLAVDGSGPRLRLV